MNGRTTERLREARVIGVVRAGSAGQAVATAMALANAGVRAVELTFTTPGVEEALAQVRRSAGSALLLGAGTLTTPTQARVAADLGVDFLVSPHVDLALLDVMLATGLLAMPGAMTPTEVAAVTKGGAEVIKLFPASSVGIPHMRALSGPFPNVQVVPTGGISAQAAVSWLAAGALAVGMGGELCPRNLVAAGAWDELTRYAAATLAEEALVLGGPPVGAELRPGAGP